MPRYHVHCLIRQVLEDKGLSQKWLADAVKVDATAINRLIQGKHNPRVTLAIRIARQLGVPVASLWPAAAPKRRK